MKTLAIVNPASAGGATGENWSQIQDKIARAMPGIDFQFTQNKPGSAALIARNALQGKYEKILAIGGDGTLSETVNGLFDNDEAINPDIIFSYIMLGRGNDFQRSIQVPADIDSAILACAGADIRHIDIGRVRYTRETGTGVRYFLNIASMGMSGEVDRAMNATNTASFLGGSGAFLFATLQTLVSYQNKPVTLTIDERVFFDAPLRVAAIANGRFFGGGMEIAPNAQLNDGRFSVTIVGDLNAFEVAMNTPLLYQGKHLPSDKIHHVTAQKVYAESSVPVYLDIDGEAIGMLPAEFVILPKKLKLQADFQK